jgi:hypothetical protein
MKRAEARICIAVLLLSLFAAGLVEAAGSECVMWYRHAPTE